MEAKNPQLRNPLLGTAVGVALAIGGVGFAGNASAQQATQPPSGTPTAAEQAAQQELREAHREIRSAGQEITEAREQSSEAVRAGREAGRAAQEAARADQGGAYGHSSGDASGAASTEGARTRTATAGAAGTASSSGTASSAGDASSGGMSSDGAASRQAASQRGSANAPDAVWLLVPVAVSTRTEQQSNECWVRLYSGDDFEGRYITITGPAELPELRSPYGTGLNNWESAIVGRNATVTTYDGSNFQERSATLRGGQRYADLGDRKLGLFEDIESIRVSCSSPATGR